ncbi:5-hydroxytryptamine receptor 3B [Kryptolebias marmoratus]|uniref:5-hydroxytryptamine receptor 3B n=1 Tax=Kryptolebias marmoratus TaxID=37003 RepID=UPI0018ACA50D|nr:5-hydroxytryptamine receptor 3B [Kryptolebias marmoratus]
MSNYTLIEIQDENTTTDGQLDFDKASSQSSEENPHYCTYQDVLEDLNMTRSNDKYTMTRPTLNHKKSTPVFLQMAIYAILDVREVDQTFISYVWIDMKWNNPHISWNKSKFCDISEIIVPTDSLWKPDLMIEEMVEKDKAPPSPFLKLNSNGKVEYRNDLVVVSTCRMHIYKFPFDVQSCNVSFKSVVHSNKELEIFFNKNNTALTKWSRRVMQTQYEWLFMNQSVTNKTVNHFGFNQTVIVYTIKMKRRSALYVANFLIPVLFFLCLDLASLLMSNSGEKIGFKVSVLLAVTVMQLLLNEILPVSSNSIPLIVIYCIGIFALMKLSLLETIFVTYLMEKDSASQDGDADSDPRINEENEIKKCSDYMSIFDEMAHQTTSNNEEVSRSQLTELFLAVEKVSDELGAIKKKVNLLGSDHEKKPGYWTRVANRITKGFQVFYVTAVTVFLCTLFSLWIPESD